MLYHLSAVESIRNVKEADSSLISSVASAESTDSSALVFSEIRSSILQLRSKHKPSYLPKFSFAFKMSYLLLQLTNARTNHWLGWHSSLYLTLTILKSSAVVPLVSADCPAKDHECVCQDNNCGTQYYKKDCANGGCSEECTIKNPLQFCSRLHCCIPCLKGSFCDGNNQFPCPSGNK